MVLSIQVNSTQTLIYFWSIQTTFSVRHGGLQEWTREGDKNLSPDPVIQPSRASQMIVPEDQGESGFGQC